MLLLLLFFAPKKRRYWGLGVSPSVSTLEIFGFRSYLDEPKRGLAALNCQSPLSFFGKVFEELTIYLPSYIVNGPCPMQLVVPSAVRAAVAAAMKMRRITSHTEFFFIASYF